MTSYLDSEQVPPAAATRALALILDLHRNTRNFPEVSEVRIQTHWERVVVEEEDRVWPLEKHAVGPGTMTRETSCAICLDEFSMGSEAMRMPCSHVFHGGCIVKWLEKRLVCPLCRFELPSSEETTSTADEDIDLD